MPRSRDFAGGGFVGLEIVHYGADVRPHAPRGGLGGFRGGDSREWKMMGRAKFFGEANLFAEHLVLGWERRGDSGRKSRPISLMQDDLVRC